MSGMAKLSNLLNIFRNSSATEESQQQLFHETLLMTLSRATDADAHVSPCEVKSVQAFVQKLTGEAVSEADVRVAAASELYESAPLEQYLARAGKRLTSVQRTQITQSLAQIFRSDVTVTENEVDFFNSVATALKATPAEIVGLSAG